MTRAATQRRRRTHPTPALSGPDAPDLIEFMEDQNLLGRYFAGPSWNTWKAVLKAARALPMTQRDVELFATVAGGRKPPARPVRELVVCAGRGAGKDAIASALATHIAVTADFSRLRPGERGTIMVLASDREQAGVAHGFIAGYFERVPILASMVESQTAETLNLSNGASITITTANTRAPRGRTIAAAVYDELGFWRSEESAFPDVDVDAAVQPGLLRFPGSVKVMISSVNQRKGLLYERYATYFGRDDDDALVVLGSSLDFNETLDRTAIERDLERDPERYGAEYLSRWRDDISSFIDRELVESATDRGVVVRPPRPGVQYVGFADPAGGRGDSFAAAIAHVENGTAIVDALFERPSPFNPDDVTEELGGVLGQYGIGTVTGDHYSEAWCQEAFARRGIRFEYADLDRSALYLEALPAFTTGRVRLLDNPKAANQLVSLERRAGRTGRDTVAHPDHRNAHDDLSNVICGAITLAETDAAPALIRREDMKATPSEIPGLVYLAAIFWANTAGQWAGVFIGLSASGNTLYVLDLDTGQLGLGTLDVIAERLAELAEESTKRVRRMPHAVLYAPEELKRRATDAMMGAFARHLDTAPIAGRHIAASPIPTKLTDDLGALVLSVAGHVHSGTVQLTTTAHEKTATVPLFGALSVRLGEKIADDPLRVAALLAIRLGLGPQ